METTLKDQTLVAKTSNLKTQVKTEAKTAGALTDFWVRAEANRFGIMPIVLVIVGCMGGISAGFGAKDDIVKLGVIIFPTIFSLSFMLAVSPMRLILWTSLIAVIADIAVLFI